MFKALSKWFSDFWANHIQSDFDKQSYPDYCHDCNSEINCSECKDSSHIKFDL